MKILGLLRHAKSDWSDVRLSDYDRGLNARGRKGAALMGKHIAGHRIRWDAALASPAARVQETLAASGLPCDFAYDEELYLADVSTLMDKLRALPASAGAALLAGHNPGLHELVFSLVGPDRENELFDAAAEKFPTAAFAVLELDIDDWADLGRGCGRLVHLARPRDLDPELGPEHVR